MCRYCVDTKNTVTSDPPEPDSAELQEAVSKTTFRHEFLNLEPATTYSVYLKAYSALGGSQQSSTITATTLGGGRPENHRRGKTDEQLPVSC